MTLIARSPTRIDLAGGTVDLWPLYLLVEHGATVNLAIDRYTEARVDTSPDDLWHVEGSGRTLSARAPMELAAMEGGEIAGRLIDFFRPDAPLTIRTRSQAPPQAGLAGSSSLGISIAGALNGLTGFRYDAPTLIEIVKDVEVELLRAMTGAQDHYPPVFGGAQCLWWGKPPPSAGAAAARRRGVSRAVRARLLSSAPPLGSHELGSGQAVPRK